MTGSGFVLAHQGGWDEILMVLVPMALFVGLLWLANRRANAEVTRRQRAEGEPSADRAGNDPGDDATP